MTALALVQQYYAYFNAQNWEGMLSLLAEDIRHEVNQGEPRIGKTQYRAFLAHMDRCYTEQLTDFVYYTEPTDTRVACEFVVHGQYKETDGDLTPARGQRYVLPVGTFVEVKQGKIVRVTTYYNLEAWLKMVE